MGNPSSLQFMLMSYRFMMEKGVSRNGDMMDKGKGQGQE